MLGRDLPEWEEGSRPGIFDLMCAFASFYEQIPDERTREYVVREALRFNQKIPRSRTRHVRTMAEFPRNGDHLGFVAGSATDPFMRTDICF